MDGESAETCVRVETFHHFLKQSELPPNVAPVSDTSASSSDTVCKHHRDTSWVEQEYRQPSISWGTVKIQSYPILAGDHPDTIQGPPLTIAWECVAEKETDLDEYEANRVQRRHGEDLRLSWLERRKKLRRVGVTEDAIYEAVEASHRVRRQRQQTTSWRMKLEKVEEFQQSLRKSVGKTLHPKRSKVLTTKY